MEKLSLQQGKVPSSYGTLPRDSESGSLYWTGPIPKKATRILSLVGKIPACLPQARQCSLLVQMVVCWHSLVPPAFGISQQERASCSPLLLMVLLCSGT